MNRVSILAPVLRVGFFVFVLGGAVGCRTTSPAGEMQSPRSARSGAISDALIGSRPAPPRVLQQQGMSFADRFAMEWDTAAQLLAAPASDAAQRVAVLAYRVHQTAQILDIAAGPDPRMNLLNLVVFLQAGEFALRQGLIIDIPASARQYLAGMYGRLLAEADGLLGDVLLPTQEQRLQTLVSEWLAGRPGVTELSSTRLAQIPGVRLEDFADLRKTTGLWANLSRWMGQVNTSLLFGERVLFLAERTPRILSQQTDLTLAQIAQNFPITTWKPDLNEAGDWLETLPTRLQRGWTAAYGEVDMQSLANEGGGLLQDTRMVVADSREFLQAATSLSLALQANLEEARIWWKTDDADGETGAASASALVAQARESLTRLDTTITGLNTLLATTAHLDPLALQAAALTATDRVIDRVFQRALILLLVAFLGGVLLLLLARFLFRPGTPTANPPPSQ